MIADPRKFLIGAGLLVVFAAVLVLLFLPMSDGQNPMTYLDALYNAISKQSAYNIPRLHEEAGRYHGRELHLNLSMGDATAAGEAVAILAASGVAVQVTDAEIEIRGELTQILTACLEDSDLMFANNGGALEEKYGLEGRRVLFRWWQLLEQMDRGLKRQSKFDEAKIIGTVIAKGLESAYNYYGIEPVRINEKLGVVIFSLAFYVLYTVWYGFAIIFIFEGFGLKLSH